MTSRRLISTKSTSAAAIGLLMLTPLAGMATDAKIHTAAGCKAIGTNSGHKISFNINGKATNNSTNRAYWVCPFVRDVLGKPMERVSVRVDDQHPNSDIYCYFKALDGYDNAHYTKTMRSNGTGLQGITVSGNSCSGNCIGEPPAMAYVMYCSVPGKHNGKASSVLEYQLREKS